MARPTIDLKSFDAAEDDDFGLIRPKAKTETAPSTKARKAASSRRAKPAGEDAANSTSAPAVDETPAGQDTPPVDETPPVDPTPQADTTPTRESTAKKATAPKRDATEPSNVYVPVNLKVKLQERCKTDSRTHGELIIIALETTYDNGLKDALNPRGETGGSLFTARRSRAARTVDGELTSLNFRLLPKDFQVLDQLVDELGASSRGDLITVALNLYLND